MIYELTQLEKEKIKAGDVITVACYHPEECALCELIGEYNKVKLKFEESESPTGKRIFIFFFYPTTFYQAFRIGDMTQNKDLYKSQFKNLLANWQNKFKS